MTVGACRFKAGLIAAVLVLFAGCTQPSTSLSPEAKADVARERPPERAIAGPIPPSVGEAYRTAEQAFDAVSAQAWLPATTVLAALKRSLRQVRTDLNPIAGSNTDGVTSKEDQVDSGIAALAETIRARDRESARREANTVTQRIAQLAEMFANPVPGELMMLNYYSRQFDIGASLNDASLLTGTAESIRQTWTGLRPAVEASGGTKEAGRFNDLVSDLEKSGGHPGQLPGLLRDRIAEIREVLKQ